MDKAAGSKELPVLPDKRFDDREFIYFEFLVLWRMGIIKSPLFKRDISADEIPLSFKEKVLLKQVLKAVKGTDIELLLQDSGLIKKEDKE